MFDAVFLPFFFDLFLTELAERFETQCQTILDFSIKSVGSSCRLTALFFGDLFLAELSNGFKRVLNCIGGVFPRHALTA